MATMRSSLKERLERLGPVRGVDRVGSGSPVTIVLRRLGEGETVRVVGAAEALARRGVPLLRAKRAVEQVLDKGEAVLRAPVVDSASMLARELAAAGFAMAEICPPR